MQLVWNWDTAEISVFTFKAAEGSSALSLIISYSHKADVYLASKRSRSVCCPLLVFNSRLWADDRYTAVIPL